MTSETLSGFLILVFFFLIDFLNKLGKAATFQFHTRLLKGCVCVRERGGGGVCGVCEGGREVVVVCVREGESKEFVCTIFQSVTVYLGISWLLSCKINSVKRAHVIYYMTVVRSFIVTMTECE